MSKRRLGIVTVCLGLLACGHPAPQPGPVAEKIPATPAKQGRLPSALKRVDHCKGRRLSSDADEALDKLKAGAKAFFQADHYDSNGMLLNKRFPVFPDTSPKAPAADPYAPTTVDWTPGKPCCDQPTGRCEPRPADWNSPAWRALYFQKTEPFDFQVRYSAQGTNTKASFTIEVREDRGCSGRTCVYRLTGRVDDEFGVLTKGPELVRR